MGYYIRFLPKKRKTPNWKVQYISHKKEHVRKSNAKNPGRTWDIPRERWSELGFRSYMSIEQARGRQRQLNTQLALKRLEERYVSGGVEVGQEKDKGRVSWQIDRRAGTCGTPSEEK